MGATVVNLPVRSGALPLLPWRMRRPNPWNYVRIGGHDPRVHIAAVGRHQAEFGALPRRARAAHPGRHHASFTLRADTLAVMASTPDLGNIVSVARRPVDGHQPTSRSDATARPEIAGLIVRLR